MTEHAVVIAGGGPTGLMLAGELALAGVDVAIVERRESQDLAGLRAGGLHVRTIEVLDQRGIADRFVSQGQVIRSAPFARITLDISDLPTRHKYFLALWQTRIERILADWVSELAVPIYRGREVTGFAQNNTGVAVELSDGRSLRAKYLVGCDGGRSLIRKNAGIDFPGWDPSTSYLIAEVETAEEPEWGIRRNKKGINAFAKLDPVAFCILQLVKYSSGVSPTKSLKRTAKAERDIPHAAASDSTVQRCSTFSCMDLRAEPICGSKIACSRPLLQVSDRDPM
jgi:2-polyprenyl-6-methoxyphenol hydroxylase-like FAD-dependent oxidoreductase